MVSSDSDNESNDVLDAGKYYVYAVNFFIAILSVSCQYFVIWQYLADIRANKLLHIGFLNILTLYVFLNYYLACFTPPGKPPLGWVMLPLISSIFFLNTIYSYKHKSEMNEPPISGVKVYELKRNSDKPRYCIFCKSYKPPRTHHCSDCDVCVLKMDHHCPWINNCIGLRNQGHFWRFLFSVVLTSSYGLYFHYGRLYDLIVDAYHGTFYARQPSQSEVSFLVINTSLLITVFIAVGVLFGFQTILVANNTTSIERKENIRIKKIFIKNSKSGKKRISAPLYPYNLGIIRNFKAVLGDTLFLFWFPKKIIGDGIEFAVRDGLELPVYWPPLEYYNKYLNVYRKPGKRHSKINVFNDREDINQCCSNGDDHWQKKRNDSDDCDKNSEGPSTDDDSSRPDSDAELYDPNDARESSRLVGEYLGRPRGGEENIDICIGSGVNQRGLMYDGTRVRSEDPTHTRNESFYAERFGSTTRLRQNRMVEVTGNNSGYFKEREKLTGDRVIGSGAQNIKENSESVGLGANNYIYDNQNKYNNSKRLIGSKIYGLDTKHDDSGKYLTSTDKDEEDLPLMQVYNRLLTKKKLY
ncbi:hypothetical protein BB560_003041 [Smittium megazygosporum]|uniref:Palmitoyltransferase n=1 Tax=Smittium megazygosporum TaxID=133381 RepID=A0A2T9ZD28_9FUNG|nr:hypothetical protein BB560_003041 [Smittium megazygosporum]